MTTGMTRGWVLVALVGMLIPAGAAWAAEVDLIAAVNSAYVWRGQVLNDEAVLQPELAVSSDIGLAFDVWANADLTDRHDTRKKISEVDLMATYTLPLEGPVGVDIGAVEYSFPNTSANSTHEAFGKVSLDVLLQPALSCYYDFGEVEDFYAMAGISHSFELPADGLTLDLGGSVGFGGQDYNKYYFRVVPEDEGEPIGADGAAFNDATGTAALNYAINDALSVNLNAGYTYLLDSAVRDGAKELYGDDSKTFWGGKLTYTF